MMIYEQIQNINRDRNYEKKSIKILVLKSTITAMINLLEFNSRCKWVEERFSKSEDITIKIIQSEEEK